MTLSKEMLLLLNLAATWYMVGLIWLVQLVHYPLFLHVGEAKFAEYERLHTNWTSWAVGPAMLVEVATAAAVVFWVPRGCSPWWMLVGLIVLLAVWGVTAVCSVPMHARLEKGYDEAAIRYLVATNWLRTIGWTIRGVLMAAMLWQCLNSRPEISVR